MTTTGNITFILPEFRSLYPKSGKGWQYYTITQDLGESLLIQNKFHNVKFEAQKIHLKMPTDYANK